MRILAYKYCCCLYLDEAFQSPCRVESHKAPLFSFYEPSSFHSLLLLATIFIDLHGNSLTGLLPTFSKTWAFVVLCYEAASALPCLCFPGPVITWRTAPQSPDRDSWSGIRSLSRCIPVLRCHRIRLRRYTMDGNVAYPFVIQMRSLSPFRPVTMHYRNLNTG